MRPDWLNLNGAWQFAFDEAGEGRGKGYAAPGRALGVRCDVT